MSDLMTELLTIQNTDYVTTSTVAEQLKERFVVNTSTRNITVPPSFNEIGVANDTNAQTAIFEIDRYYDGVDLSEQTCVIHHANMNDTSIYPVTSKEVTTEGKLLFSWTIDNKVTKKAGKVSFAVQFYTIEGSGGDAKFSYCWNSKVGIFTVGAGLNVIDNIIIEVSPLSQILADIDNMKHTISTIQQNGGSTNYTLPSASTTTKGGVMLDGTTIVDSGNGVISAKTDLSGLSVDITDGVLNIQNNNSTVASAPLPVNSSINPSDKMYLKSPNGSVYEITVNDLGILQAKTLQSDDTSNLEDLIPNRLLVWHDEFNGTELDLSKWSYEYGIIRQTNAFYTMDSKNVSVANGNLVLKAIKDNPTADRQWSSAQIHTNNKFETMYGRLEAKIKFPSNYGSWNAFWTVGAGAEYLFDLDDGGYTNVGRKWPVMTEMDIVEWWGESKASANVHYVGANGVHAQIGSQYTGALDLSAYHIYAVEWTPTLLTFYCDGSVVTTFDTTIATHNGFNGFNYPHYMLMGVGINSAMDLSASTKYEVDVEWIRVYAPESVTTKVEPTSIKLSKNYIYTGTAKINSSYELDFTINPSESYNKTVLWSSTNTSVATGYGGYVTLLGSGNTTITAQTSNGYTDTCFVKVSDLTYQGGYINDSGILTTLADNYTSDIYLAVMPNTSYKLSFPNSQYIRVAEYTENYTFIRRIISAANSKTFSFTTSATTKCLRIGLHLNAAGATDIPALAATQFKSYELI